MDQEAEQLRQQKIVLGLQIALPIFAIASFGTRIYVRTNILRRISIDDRFMGGALVLYFMMCIAGYLMYRQEQALAAVGVSQIIPALSSLFIYIKLFYSFYTLTVITVKVSLGCFFLYFFNINQIMQRSLIYFMLGVSTALGIANVGMIAGTCGLGSLVVECRIGDAFNALSNTWNIVNSVTDFVFLGLSAHALFGTHLKAYMKISAFSLLALACVGGALSVVRALTVVHAQRLSRAQQSIPVILIGRWSTLEAGLYIITGCLATLKPLLQKIMSRFNDCFSTRKTAKTNPFMHELVGQPVDGKEEVVVEEVFIVQVEDLKV